MSDRTLDINEWGVENRAELEKLEGDRGQFTIPRDVVAATPSDMWQAFINGLGWKTENGRLELWHHQDPVTGDLTIRWQPAVPDTFKGIQRR